MLCPEIDGGPRADVARFVEPPAGATLPSLPRESAVGPSGFERLFARMLGQPGQNEADPSVLVAVLAAAALRIHVRRRAGGGGGGRGLAPAQARAGPRAARSGASPRWSSASCSARCSRARTSSPRGGCIRSSSRSRCSSPRSRSARRSSAGGARARRAAGSLASSGARLVARDAGLVLAYVALLAAVAAPAPSARARRGGLVRDRRGADGGARRDQRDAGGRRAVRRAPAAAGREYRVVRARPAHSPWRMRGSPGRVSLADAAGGTTMDRARDRQPADHRARGVVVGIQTTRLVMFEFFVRFTKGTGRSFRPASAVRPLPHRNGSHE